MRNVLRDEYVTLALTDRRVAQTERPHRKDPQSIAE
jgi:hypothetical protein